MVILHITLFILFQGFSYTSQIKVKDIDPEVRISEKVETWWDGKDYRFICVEIGGLKLGPILSKGEIHKSGEVVTLFEPTGARATYASHYSNYSAIEAKSFTSELEPFLFLVAEQGEQLISEKMIKVVDSTTLQAYFLVDDFANCTTDDISFSLTYRYWTNMGLQPHPSSSLRNSPIILLLDTFKINIRNVAKLDTSINDIGAPLANKPWLENQCKINPDIIPLKYSYCSEAEE